MFGLKFFIARRFLFSKKSHSVINIISLISVFSVAIITAALVIILSAINGFEDTIKGLYSKFDPDIKITAVKGKTFLPDEAKIKKLKTLDFVQFTCPTVEEICLFKNDEQWRHAEVKGVDENFLKMIKLQENMDGEAVLKLDSGYFMILGSVVAQNLNADLQEAVIPDYLRVYAPLRTKKMGLATKAFNEETVPVSGVFHISPELDNQYVITHIALMDRMLEYEGEISAIEIGLKPGTDDEEARDKIDQVMGNDFDVKTRYQQKELIYKTNQTEKLFVFIIMVFVLILAGFNVIAAVTMLVIDKQKDTATLEILGLTRKKIKQIFTLNGLLINLLGGGIGLAIGVGLVLLQYHYHIVPMSNAIIDYYPVKLIWTDVLKSFAALMGIAIFSSWFPVWLAMRKNN
ncbi:MAG TPA: FtsX-like permease family protein [Flavobacteriales bacterium]|nr:FtsX-like permease family protein [Flavobacteriales bacterium]